MDRRQFTVAATLGLAASALALANRAEAGEKHPHIHEAIVALEAAKSDMESAGHDFGGHKKEALEAVHKAHEQLKICMKFDK